MPTALTSGKCPAPFLPASDYPGSGGYVAGRFCSAELGVECCLPCPSTAWFYPERFATISYATDWINVASLICATCLLLSFAFLPVEKTHRHYLSVCLGVATIMMNLGFIIPLGAKPNQCYDAITPNDMHTSSTCAWSGAFLVAGGWSAVMWVFLRSLALHLQICWEMIIGKKFMWGALITGWGVPAIALTLAMVFSGVSFRFGSTCHINHKNSLADLWIPLLVFAGATLIIQTATFGYCIKVYLASLGDTGSTSGSSGLPSYANSTRNTLTPRQAYRRVRRVIALQWRGITVVFLIVADVVFFAIVFVFMDDIETSIIKDPGKAQDWVRCLVINRGDKDKCVSQARALVVNESTITAVLLLLSLNGCWALIFLGRICMLKAWVDKIRNVFKPEQHEFLSADAQTYASDPRSYEMLSKERDFGTPSMGRSPTTSMLSPTVPLTPTTQIASPPLPQLSPDGGARSGRHTPDYFGGETRYPQRLRGWEEKVGASMAEKEPSYVGVAQAVVPGPRTVSHAVHVSFTGMAEKSRVDPLDMHRI